LATPSRPQYVYAYFPVCFLFGKTDSGVFWLPWGYKANTKGSNNRLCGFEVECFYIWPGLVYMTQNSLRCQKERFVWSTRFICGCHTQWLGQNKTI